MGRAPGSAGNPWTLSFCPEPQITNSTTIHLKRSDERRDIRPLQHRPGSTELSAATVTPLEQDKKSQVNMHKVFPSSSAEISPRFSHISYSFTSSLPN